MPLKYEELTSKILAACFKVRNELVEGFLQQIYEKALLIVLDQKGIHAKAQFPIDVSFRYQSVGLFHADIFVEKCCHC